jgi:hypothetical protein
MFTRCYAFMYDRISGGSERAGLRDERAAFWRRHGATRSRSAPAPGSTSPLLGVGHEPFRYSWMGCHPNRATLEAITRSKTRSHIRSCPSWPFAVVRSRRHP